MFPRILFSGLVALPLALAMVVGAAAQTDPRVTQLEEQVRQLTGTIEELNFQILQMQDLIRRMQEDNELRFQEIEGRRSDAGGAERPSDHAATVPEDGGAGQAEIPRIEDGARVLGAPPRDFGTITFDADGNATGAGVIGPRDDDTAVASIPPGGNGADELYRNAYEFILSGDYGTAEAGFRELIENHPTSEHAADAHFWLGEALLAQERPREAAEVFLTASRNFPQARTAPDTLLKLGVSMAALGQRDVACATYGEVAQRFPQATDALKERIRQEQALASC